MESNGRRRAALRLAVLAGAVVVAFAALTLAGVSPAEVRGWVSAAGPAGPACFVLVGGALGWALFPGHVTAALAGALFGTAAGVGLALGAALVGAAGAFALARRFGADDAERVLGPRGLRWRGWVQANGFHAVLVSRLAPGVPSGIVNYVAGLSAIGAPAFLGAVCLGALPKTIAYVALGGALADPISGRGAVALGLYAAAALGGALAARRLLADVPRGAQAA
jgi:uncharacterized membrane protein YdjX (TVP38/TMEM64 family)